MPPRTPRTRNAGEWTEARYIQHIRSAMRAAFKWWRPGLLALQAAKVGRQYRCAMCAGLFPRKEVERDHVVPCGPMRTLDDLPGYVARMTPEDPAAFQVLCKGCHAAKTKADRAAMRDRSA